MRVSTVSHINSTVKGETGRHNEEDGGKRQGGKARWYFHMSKDYPKQYSGSRLMKIADSSRNVTEKKINWL